MSQAGEEFANEVQREAAGRQEGRSLRPWRRMLPFLKPYRWSIVASGIALVCSSTASLLLPPALGKLVQNGFSQTIATHINQYFLPLALILLAMAVRPRRASTS